MVEATANDWWVWSDGRTTTAAHYGPDPTTEYKRQRGFRTGAVCGRTLNREARRATEDDPRCRNCRRTQAVKEATDG